MKLNDEELYHVAIELAQKFHANKFRRDFKTPYITHIFDVIKRVEGDYYLMALAAFHDAPEDGYSIEDFMNRFVENPEFVHDILLLTHSKSMSYEEYLKAIKTSEKAIRVKIVDMISNLNDAPTIKQILKYAKGLQFLLS